MDKNEKFRQAILKAYPSINSFCQDTGIPKTTMSSAFKSNIGNMAADKVLMMCDKLGIDPRTFDPISTSNLHLTPDEEELITRYRELSDKHKKEVKFGVSYLLEQEKHSQ